MNEIYQEGTLEIVDNDASNTLSTLSEVHSIISSNLYKEAQLLELKSTLEAENSKTDYLKLHGLRDLAKMIWGNKSTILTLALASQGAVSAALNNHAINAEIVSNNALGNKTADLLPLFNRAEPMSLFSSNNSDVNSLKSDTDFNTITLEEIRPIMKRAAGDKWHARFDECYKLNELGQELFEISNKIQTSIPDFKDDNNVCQMTEEEMRNILSLINNPSNNGTIQNSSNDCLPIYAQDNCDRLMKGIKCDIQRITQHIQAANHNFSKEYHDKLQADYNAFIKASSLIEGIHNNTIQEITSDIDKIDDILSKIPEQFNKCKEAIENAFYNEKSDVIEFCAAKIKLGEVNKAITKLEAFRPLTQGSVDHTLSSIITEAYTDNTIFQNIVDFISQLPPFSNQLTAYSKLFEEMQKADRLGNNAVFTLHEKVAALADNNDPSFNTTQWQKLKDKLAEQVNAVNNVIVVNNMKASNQSSITANDNNNAAYSSQDLLTGNISLIALLVTWLGNA